MSRLIYQCARARPDLDAVRRLAAGVSDWDAVAAEAAGHGLAPLLYWCLKEAGAVAPAAALDGLGARFRDNARRNLYLTAELVRVVSLLERAGVAAIPFKGPALAWMLYPNPGLREFSDLDLLVRPRDLRRAIEALRADGYRPHFAAGKRFFSWVGQLPLTRDDGRVTLDLHWEFAASQFAFALDLELFWSRAGSVVMAGRQAASLAPEDLLALLCVHGAKHGWSMLVWLCDLARLIDRCAIDWDRALAHAEARRMTRMLFLGLALAYDLLDAPLPGRVKERVQADSRAAALAAATRERLAAGLPPPGGARGATAYQLRLIERTRDKLRFCWSLLLPTPADLASLRIPAALFPAYYLARPVRLLAKHGRLAARRLLSARRRAE